jgi:hypothetical protein
LYAVRSAGAALLMVYKSKQEIAAVKKAARTKATFFMVVVCMLQFKLFLSLEVLTHHRVIILLPISLMQKIR